LTTVAYPKATAGLSLPGSDNRSVPRSCGWQTKQKGLSALPTQLPSPSKNPQILRWMWVEDCEQIRFANKLLSTLFLRIVATPASRKNNRGIRRCRIPPRRAHDTLQPQDESIIVGYYTSAEVFPETLPRTTDENYRRKMPMARGDGVHRTSARNMRMTTDKVMNAQCCFANKLRKFFKQSAKKKRRLKGF